MSAQKYGGWEGGYNTYSYSHTYPTVIFDADISPFFNEALYCVLIVITHCNMEGSPLTERKKQGGPIVICELTAFLRGNCDRLVYINISDGGPLVFQTQLHLALPETSELEG